MRIDHAVSLAAGLLGLTLAAPIVYQRSAPAADVMAFEHVTVVPMDRDRLIDRQTVLVRDGRIAAVGRDGSVNVPPGAVRVDGSGKYLMPGLADMHVHPYNTDQFFNYLARGVTTIAVLNGSPEVLRWRQQVVRGELLGPTIYTAGPSLDGVPALNSAFISLATPADGRAAVRLLADAGYDFLKVYSALAPDTYNAIIAEANARHISAVGHIPMQVGVDGAIKPNGQAMVAHAEEFFRSNVDSARMAAMVRAVKQARVTVTPNMSAYADYLRSIDDLPAMLANPEMRFASAAAYSEKLPSHNRSIRQNPDQFRAALDRGLAQFRIFTKALSVAGVPLLVGTDTEIFGFAGESAHDELRQMVDAGLTPYQALEAGTRAAGEFVASNVRGAEKFGVIASGQRADLVLLAANPLASIANIERIDGVMVRGRWLPASRLRTMRDSVVVVHTRQRSAVLRFDSLVTARRIDDAEATLRELRKTSPTPIAQGVVRVKALRLLPSDTTSAIRLLEWNAQMYPESHSVYTELARVYAARGDTARALANARRVLATYPMHQPAVEIARRFSRDGR